MKRLLILTPLIIVVLVALVFVTKRGDRRIPEDCVSNPNPLFTHYPTDISKVERLNPPLMRVNTGMKGHSYIDVTERVPVYAPADGVMTDGVKYREDLGGRGDIDQYAFTIIVSCEVFYFFDHVIDPPEKIAKAFPGPAQTDTYSNGIESIEIEAGEFLGYSAGTGWHNFDFGVVNFTQDTILVDDLKYSHSEKFRHSDCPYKYFDDEKREVLFDLIGYSDASDLEVIDNLCE